MPLISEAQKKALKKLCERGEGWHQTKGICSMSTANKLRDMGFAVLKYKWSRPQVRWTVNPTPAAHAYVELLKEIEKLKEKKNERQG